jgi:hypothetical protein
MAQKFHASKADSFRWPNGAIGFRPGGPMDCLGPYAKVRNCPIAGTMGADGKPLRLTCYATGYADTHFSVPACTRYKGKHVGGYFTGYDEGLEFRPYDRFKGQLPFLPVPLAETEED